MLPPAATTNGLKRANAKDELAAMVSGKARYHAGVNSVADPAITKP
jgi:hypothetical protein